MLHYARLVRKYAQFSSISAKIHLKANAVTLSKKRESFNLENSLKMYGRKRIWYIIHHEMSKSTQTFSGLPKQFLLTISIKATPQCTDLWLGFPELQCSFSSMPESEILIETTSSQGNHKIFSMDKRTLSLLLPSPIDLLNSKNLSLIWKTAGLFKLLYI